MCLYMVKTLQVGDLVKVMGKFVEEYGIIIELLTSTDPNPSYMNVVVRMFDGSDHVVHPSRLRVLDDETKLWTTWGNI